MKPVSVRFQCFGPYMAEQLIDFEALQKNGLFLICGETGAGKTTILDAMCYALYGKSSGGLRGDMTVMRCHLAGKDDVTHVEFVFDCGGRRYKFTRTLKYGRKKLNDSHNCLVLEGEVYVPLLENPKATAVNAKAQELIGLTYDQFRQVILLPQGQFEKLLVSDSAEKERILVSLFRADRWQRIAEELYSRVAEQDKALEEEKRLITAKLGEYGCTALSQLEEKQAEQALLTQDLTRQAGETEKALTACREAQEAALLENRAFEALSQAEDTLTALEQQAVHYAAEETLLLQADKADSIRPQYQSYRTAKTEKLRAEGGASQAETTLTAALSGKQTAEQVWEKLENTRPEQEERKQRKLLLENAGELYRTLKEKESAARAAQKALTSAGAEQKQAERTYLLRSEAWETALLAQSKAIAAYQNIQSAYLRGIGSILAHKLEPGSPCPVCGSREHPAPAPMEEGHVTEAQLEAQNAVVSETAEAVSSALSRRTEAEAACTAARERYAEAARKEAVVRTEYENALSRRIQGIDTQSQLKTAVTALDKAITAFEQAETAARQELDTARDAAIAAQSKLDAARETLALAQTRYASQAAQWEQALEASGLGTEETWLAADMTAEERHSRRTALIRFRAELEQALSRVSQQRQALEGRTAPNLKAIRQAAEEAENLHKSISRRQALAAHQLEIMEADLRSLRERQNAYDAKRTAVDADLDFANRLRGRSGVSLQRYVLGVMLTSITTEANRLLKNVYGGRYQLYRTNEIAGSGHKGGLELEVWDSQTNARRSVTTLSGGEKFLVALSLAIGLSTVVQAQGSGIRLEAMFVDEGFGSLDAEAIHDALEVLQGIQRSSGIVGIISHVEALAESIPTRIEITKGRNGSRCHIRG